MKSDFRFKPRGEEQTVTRTLVASLDVTLKVMGRDLNHAVEKVDDMRDHDVFKLAGHAEAFEDLRKAGWDLSVE